MIVLIDNRQIDVDIETDDKKFIESIIGTVFDCENCTANFEISVSLVNNEEIKGLNKQYRNIDSPTDVLSFPMIDYNELSNGFIRGDFLNESKKEVLLGDIVISMNKVVEQAESYGHSVKKELAFLLIHGTLHLLGYDHCHKSDETIMFDRQKEILKHISFDG
ncbi:MAG: rRNA maturation RNase YbeY [Clostridiales bacterium]|nr:rRNA maturation RNase YbeY [Clostridiales bacterium]